MFEPDLLSGRVPIRPRRTIEKLSDTVIERLGEATSDKSGLLSAEDKAKLDGLGEATTEKAGLLSAEDKAKLDELGILGYTNHTVDYSQSNPFLALLNKKGNYLFLKLIDSAGQLTEASTFDLAEAPGIGGVGEISYFLLKNNTSVDFNVIHTDISTGFMPDAMELAPGETKEISIYRISEAEAVITMSGNLTQIS